MNKAIIIGASSGIGKELSKILSNENYIIGLGARRIELLEILSKELKTKTYVKQIDISKAEEAMNKLNELIQEMNDVDLIIICAGIGYINPELNWENENETIDVNVKGFTCIVNTGFKYFIKKGSGHIVALSSIAALRGSGYCPAYNASKAYISNYLEGLRCKARKISRNITITDIKPGFVDTEMAKGEGLFWVAAPEKAAKQILKIIRFRKERGYVTKRWGLIALLIKIMPNWLYYKL